MRTLKIGIDARPLSQGEGAGVSQYVYNMVNGLVELKAPFSIYLYSNKKLNNSWNSKIKIRRYRSKLGSIGYVFFLPFLIRKDKLDFFWGTSHILPLFIPKKIKTLLTIHDLVYKIYPKSMKWTDLLVHFLFFQRSIKRSNRIVCVSNHVKEELESYYGNINKVSVIYEAANSKIFFEIKKTISMNFLKSEYGLNSPFFLILSSIEPRKNFKRILESAADYIIENKLVYQIVLVGGRGWNNSDEFKLISDLSSKEIVKYLGYVPSDDLKYLYSGAKMLLFISKYEGFGLPIVEAMSCGCPVITSNKFAMNEIAGEAAVKVNPDSSDEIKKGISIIIKDNKMFSDLGLQRVKMFSWEKAANEFANTLMELLY